MRITFLALQAVSLFHINDVVYSSITGNDQHVNISIVDGSSAAKPGQFPFMASLPFPLGSCGGTSISPSYILTAAHCISFYTEADTVDFIVPEHIERNGQRHLFPPIIRVIFCRSRKLFERWHKLCKLVNDIALLVLTKSIREIKPVPLPKVLATFVDKTTIKPPMKTTLKSAAKPLTTKEQVTTKKPEVKDSSPYANMDAVITGWGVQADGFHSDVLMTATVTINDNSICSLKWGGKLFNGNTMMCANKGGTSACMNGDGGPILVNGVQVGIASFFPETCGDIKFPAVFTQISAYDTWIKNTMAANPPPIPE